METNTNNNNKLPIYEFIIDENSDSNMGLTAISLVDDPAIQVDFRKFESSKELFELKFANENKNELVGPLMIPGQMIYRNENGFEYYGFFSEATCIQAHEEFMSKGLTRNFNIMHKGKMISDQAFIKETWLVGSNEDKSHDLGYSLPKNTPMANVKITPELRKIVDEEGLKGFSIECFADIAKVFSNKCSLTAQDVTLAKVRKVLVDDDMDSMKVTPDFAMEYWNKQCSCSNCKELKKMGFQLPGVLPSATYPQHIKKHKLN